MGDSFDRACDVLIVGAGMAGGCLARQLALEQPDLRVVVVEKKTGFDWSIGESTVEVFDDYAVRNLKLGPYLASRHIVKHGLRFWFDSAAKDLPVRELSEQGRSRYTTLNRGVQIDRAVFDRDLCEINRQRGVEVLLGTRIERVNGRPGIEIDAARGHRVQTSAGVIRCRYLVDAAGRASPLAALLDLTEPDPADLAPIGSYWGRFEGCRSIDDLGDDGWRRRVEHTLRWSSTNHFMYDGYWIWLIPLNEAVASFGVTFDHRRLPLKLHSGAELEAFLRRHRALDEILGAAARPLDFGAHVSLIRGARRFYSADRWYLAGMSAFFVDPLFSTSSALIAVGNRLIAELIATDRAGDRRRLARRLTHFNVAMRNVYLRQRRAFDRYHSFGSFDAFMNWQTLRYHSLLNYEVPMQHADHRPMIEQMDAHGDDCACAEGAWSESQSLGEAADRLTDEFVVFVDERGKYYARNRGYFHEKTERPATRYKTVALDFGDAVLQESRLNWEAFVRYYVGRMCEMDGVPFDEECFVGHFEPDWRAGQRLVDVLTPLRARAAAGGPARPALVRWDPKGPIDDRTAREANWWCRFTGPDGTPVA